MTFIIVLYVREGIVVASDSRLTLNTTSQEGERQVVKMSVAESDSNSKLFLTSSKVGIATLGQADIQGVPIAGYVESFIKENLSNDAQVDEIPQRILKYFRDLSQSLDTTFVVTGYKKNSNTWEQQVWEVKVSKNSAVRVDEQGSQGAYWGGEGDVLSRLLQPVGINSNEGFQPYPNYPIQFGYFTLQDAIDYSIYAVKVTIDTMRFHPRPKTVGGPIDVLVIKPDEAIWVQKKMLHV
jgi:hypothetical protein